MKNFDQNMVLELLREFDVDCQRIGFLCKELLELHDANLAKVTAMYHMRLAEITGAYNDRVTGLLEANNREVERRREATNELAITKAIIHKELGRYGYTYYSPGEAPWEKTK